MVEFPSAWTTLPRSKSGSGLWEAAAVLCVLRFQQLNQRKMLGLVIKHEHLIIVIWGEGMHTRKLGDSEKKSGCKCECFYVKIPMILDKLSTSLKSSILISSQAIYENKEYINWRKEFLKTINYCIIFEGI